MQRRILTILLVGLSGFIFTAPAGAAKSPHRYSPRHGTKCHKAYKRVVKHRRHHRTKVFCVKRAARKHRATPTVAPTIAPTATTAPQALAPEKAKLHAHLDPEYVQNPLNPFEVTYAYSASATQEVAGTAARTAAVEEPAPLPSGVLSLYSDGMLECAINVGSGVEGSECPVTYQRLGEHKVTTIYTSGEQSATETEVENIEPLTASVALSVDFEATAPEQGLLHITATSGPALSLPGAKLSVSVPGYWDSTEIHGGRPPTASGQTITLEIQCGAGLGQFREPGWGWKGEPLSYFAEHPLIATFGATGYSTATATAALPEFTSCATS